MLAANNKLLAQHSRQWEIPRQHEVGIFNIFAALGIALWGDSTMAEGSA